MLWLDESINLDILKLILIIIAFKENIYKDV